MFVAFVTLNLVATAQGCQWVLNVATKVMSTIPPLSGSLSRHVIASIRSLSLSLFWLPSSPYTLTHTLAHTLAHTHIRTHTPPYVPQAPRVYIFPPPRQLHHLFSIQTCIAAAMRNGMVVRARVYGQSWHSVPPNMARIGHIRRRSCRALPAICTTPGNGPWCGCSLPRRHG